VALKPALRSAASRFTMRRMEETQEVPVKRLRLYLGMTAVEFARAIDTTGPYLSTIENRKQDVGHVMAIRIRDRFPDSMARLGLTVEDLIRGARL